MNTVPVTVRPATAADLDDIADVHARARATYYEGYLPEERYRGAAELRRQREGTARAMASDSHLVLAAEHGGRVVGFAVLGLPAPAGTRVGEPDGERREGTLYHFHVDPDRWRAGIGTALHAACVEAWRNARVTVARLEVFGPNQRARAFYARQGWREDGRAGDHIVTVLPLPDRAGER